MKSNVSVELVLIDMLHKTITTLYPYRLDSERGDTMRRGPRHPMARSRMG
jgi:hypothetical protein